MRLNENIDKQQTAELKKSFELVGGRLWNISQHEDTNGEIADYLQHYLRVIETEFKRSVGGSNAAIVLASIGSLGLTVQQPAIDELNSYGNEEVRESGILITNTLCTITGRNGMPNEQAVADMLAGTVTMQELIHDDNRDEIRNTFLGRTEEKLGLYGRAALGLGLVVERNASAFRVE